MAHITPLVLLLCVIGISNAAYDYKVGQVNARGVRIGSVDLVQPPADKLRFFGTPREGDAMEHILNMNIEAMNKSSETGEDTTCLSEGDIVVPCGDTGGRGRRNAIRDRSLRWPNGVVPYTIDNRFDYGARQRIQTAIQRYHDTTCIRFVQRTNQRDYVEVFPGNGCYSLVGRVGGRQQLSLGVGCTTNLGTIIHEFMHAIGFQHEQTRADRDSFVYIYTQNIIRGLEYNFDKYDLTRINHLGTSYDYFSVMHYHMTAFSANGQPTIVARDQRVRLDYRSDFSNVDIDEINILYECSECNGHFPSLNPDDCVDKNEYCQAWAEAGFCQRNPQWMLANCLISCDVCQPDTGTGGGNENCRDMDESCEYWASIGECEANPSWMLPNCQVSCNQCDVVTAGENCVDLNDNCALWARFDQCSVNPDYMLTNCPKSCGQCSEGLMKSCEDYNENCPDWAAYDQCDLNPGYMNYNCRKSCGLCTASSPLDLVPQAQCQDTNGYCSIYQSQGMCESKPEYMNMFCPSTCGMCPEQLYAGNGASGRWSLQQWLVVALATVVLPRLV
ncbi:zinc metalloproteinase nas-6-like [Diadema antillarum]|uniref:zinc metalloproteinase nas-6-like n=1 Tax=Diadema antillarum TaxID=105358 RepID=UPI003A863A57